MDIMTKMAELERVSCCCLEATTRDDNMIGKDDRESMEDCVVELIKCKKQRRRRDLNRCAWKSFCLAAKKRQVFPMYQPQQTVLIDETKEFSDTGN